MLTFHQPDGRVTMLPIHVILYIDTHHSGGATIFTSIEVGESKTVKNFRSIESVKDLSRSLRPQAHLPAGAFSSV